MAAHIRWIDNSLIPTEKVIRHKAHKQLTENRKKEELKKKEFHTHTGTVEYFIEEMDGNAKQLLKIGSLIGAGPKPSFGLGFMDVTTD